MGNLTNQKLNEKQTRKRLIDTELKRVGWLEKYIKEEVNSVKSDFKNKNYILDNGIYESGDHYIDYLLLGEDNSPIAIIEAKRYSKDPQDGRIQARTYAKDIESQTGVNVPIFLTNGYVWELIDEKGIERKVSRPFSQKDIERRADLFKNEKSPKDLEINSYIVDRPRSVQIVKRLSEHFSEGHKKALIEMATGTGKTRVAMAVCDILIRSNYARNILFIADRTVLVDQALNKGFKKYFIDEAVADLRNGYNLDSRLYVSTVQTLKNGDDPLFEKYSPGFFDLVIFDEAHRSYYDKNNVIMNYFDAIQIGLTATPKDEVSHNTYDLFGCDKGVPTAEYSYDEAVQDGVLVPYIGKIIETEVLSLGIEGIKLSDDLKDQLRRQEQDPDLTEFSGSEFERIFLDDKTNELIIHQFMKYCYRSDDSKPAKTIFFCMGKEHAKKIKKLFSKLYPSYSNDVQVILSDMQRYQDEVKRFEHESEPRIVISVGIMDTGVDVPEVSNLVFVKPVFSKTRFWQMVGRGTRNFKACDHPEWLPEGDKKDFLILDFKVGGHSNILYHEFTPTTEGKPKKDTVSKIFENRVELLSNGLFGENKEIITEKVIESIEKLDNESFIVRERLPIIREIHENKFNIEKYISELRNDILPLMITTQGENPKISSFVLISEKLYPYILENKLDNIEKIKKFIIYRAENILLKDNLEDVKVNRESIISIMQENFWDDLTFSKVDSMIKTLAPLMKYYTKIKGNPIQIDAPDVILSVENYTKQISENTELKEFLENNEIARKIYQGIGISSVELLKLEAELVKLKPEISINSIQNIYKKDFLVFIREMLKMKLDNNPRELIELRFDEFIINSRQYNSKQIEFLNLLKKVFSDRKHIELSDFSKAPFKDENPLDRFEFDELESIVNKCNNNILMK